ncbi:hypothetical protein T10_948 [Trichinella papuae]|uniref:Uncharacterized protein n=1 Tax=Trichinella papuae TaxID=268474 RepID=A0A0V1MTR2_9BILA|nr:hypothetical protein T10_948 [Trichinella papuae]
MAKILITQVIKNYIARLYKLIILKLWITLINFFSLSQILREIVFKCDHDAKKFAAWAVLIKNCANERSLALAFVLFLFDGVLFGSIRRICLIENEKFES